MKGLLLFGFLVCSFNGISQNFAPLGAEWYYTMTYQFSPDISFYYLSVESDTIIEEQECRTINLSGSPCLTYAGTELHIYDEEEKVYFYNQYTESFEILYDFGLETNESWTTINSPGIDIDTMEVTVDSISQITINDTQLKVLHVTYSYLREDAPWTYPGLIYERIGDLNFVFNYFSGYVACRGTGLIQLRCYSDNEFGYYETGIADSCNQIITGIKENNNEYEISLFPNPSSDFVKVNSKRNYKFQFNIYDGSGKLLENGIIDSQGRINLSQFNRGLYFIAIKHNGEIVLSQSLVRY